MPAPDSPTVLVARFLRDNHFDQTLSAFLEETGLDLATVDPKHGKKAFTIEDVLDEKRLYDLALKSEHTPAETDVKDQWTIPHPSIPTTLIHLTVRPANVLSVNIFPLTTNDTPDSPVLSTIVITDASKNLHLFSAHPPYPHLRSTTHTSPILSVHPVSTTHLLASTMTGHITLLSSSTLAPLAIIPAHTKHAVRVLFDPSTNLVVSSSYDKTITTHQLSLSAPYFTGPHSHLTLPTRPEALAILRDPRLSNGDPLLVFSREDSTFLYLHHLSTPGLPLFATHNLGAVSHGWNSFHAMAIAVDPKCPSVLAVGTNNVPSMKLQIVDLAEPQVEDENEGPGFEKLAVFVQAAQSAYSTAVVAWRPDGTGVWVNADDGVVRGVGMDGKVVDRLQVCEKGEKVRCLWAGEVVGEDGTAREVLVTGGFDKRVQVWEVGRNEDERIPSGEERVVEVR